MELERAWAEARAGKPVIVLASGTAASLPARAGTVLRVAAEPNGAAIPLQVAGRILSDTLGLLPEDTGDPEVAEALRFILTGGAERALQADPTGMTPDHRRAVAFGHFNARLCALAERAPLALVIENAGWIDEASQAWLASFGACFSPEPPPIWHLAGARPAEAPRAAAAAPTREGALGLLEAAERSLACVATRTAMEQIQEAAACFAELGIEDQTWKARLLDARAAAHAAAGSLPAAILHSRQRLALGGPPAELCRAYDRHIGYLVKKGEPGQALTTCQEALGRIPDGTPGRTKLVARRAQSLLLAGRHQEALAECATCLAALDPDSDANLAGFIYLLWGGVEIRRLELFKARSALEGALGHFRAAGDLYNQAISLSDLGTVHVRLGEAGQAAACFDQGLLVADRIADRRLRAVLLNNLGMLVHQQGDLAAARAYFAQALAIHREMADQRSMGIALLNLGEMCLALFERDAADKYLSEALAVNEKIGAWDVMAETYRQIARLEGDRGDKRAALDSIKQGTQIAEQTGQIELQGVMLRLVAGLQADLGNMGEALSAVAQSIEILRGIDAPLELGRSFAEQGRLLRGRGQVEGAAEALAQAESLFTRINAQFELEQLRAAP